jgi:NAD(P)H-hydrate epimerase
VHYSSVPENNELVAAAKNEFRNGIVVKRADVADYIAEDDCVLIGPGMTRDKETEALTNTLLANHRDVQWVIDAGALQMLDLIRIPPGAILTPHHREFEQLWTKRQSVNASANETSDEEKVKTFAQQYGCIVLLKGQKDIICNGAGECRVVEGGNAGMTKGGTGDVLAGLIAALACMNDPWLATLAGSFINKKAGDALFKTVGPFFNATDLANQIPVTMKELLIG